MRRRFHCWSDGAGLRRCCGGDDASLPDVGVDMISANSHGRRRRRRSSGLHARGEALCHWGDDSTASAPEELSVLFRRGDSDGVSVALAFPPGPASLSPDTIAPQSSPQGRLCNSAGARDNPILSWCSTVEGRGRNASLPARCGPRHYRHFGRSRPRFSGRVPSARRRAKRFEPCATAMGLWVLACFSFGVGSPLALAQPPGPSEDGSGVVEFSFEVKKRIRERIEGFMNGPRSVTGLVANYHRIGGFDHGLDARDRDDYMKLCYALMLDYADMDMIYVGLEDGAFMGYHASGWGTYREPGESGYDASDPAMAKHYRACVDRYTGEQRNCTLPVNSDYIQCAGGCAYVELCPDKESQDACVASVSGDECGVEVKWCRQYEQVKHTNLSVTLGYVPRTYYCHDEKGTFTSDNCHFEDGKTPVDRSHLVGDYAYCGGNGQSCSGTFVGGYRSKHYDPRLRDWYKLVKEKQTALWSAPYLFFSELEMGITFAQPVYSTDDEGESETKIFHGVVAADYSFKLISQFLEQAYNNTHIQVIIFEDEEPSLTVGTSTGSKAVRKVLAADESKPCPIDDVASECRDIRVPVSELSGHRMDSFLVRAYSKLRERNFPSEELLTVTATEEDDGVTAGIYVVSSQIWEQEDSNIKWRIMVTMPSTSGSNDAILKGSKPLFGIVCFIGSLGVFLCLALFGAVYAKRKDPAVRCADFFLTEGFILGCVLLNVSTFTMLGPNTDQMCMLRMWVFPLFLVMAIAPLLVKVWRMEKLIAAASTYRRVQITHGQAAAMTLPFVLVQAIILTVFSIVDPPKATIDIKSVEGVAMEQTICRQESNAYFAVQLAYRALLILVGCILSYHTRNMDPQFGESRQLFTVMYNIAFVLMIFAILIHAMNIDKTFEIVLEAVGIFFITVFGVGVFVVPRLLAVHDRNRRRTSPEASTESGVPRTTRFSQFERPR